jgi:hypothetical protein
MKYEFDIDKIVKYLLRHKSILSKRYQWKANINGLIDLNVISKQRAKALNSLNSFDKDIQLKKVIGKRLNIAQKDKSDLFNKLSLWIIKDWGGINGTNNKETLRLVRDFLTSEKPSFKRIASTSKVGAYLNPEKYFIYDSRVAHSLNWIILSENAGQFFFPIPEGRNSKTSAFDLNVLIRLKNIDHYKPGSIKNLDERLFIKNSDKNVYVKRSEAYYEMNKLIRNINSKLWKEKKIKHLFYTEMLLFSIADREIFADITRKTTLNIMK